MKYKSAEQLKQHIIQRSIGDLPVHLPVLTKEESEILNEIRGFLLDSGKIEWQRVLQTKCDNLGYFDNFCQEMREFRKELKRLESLEGGNNEVNLQTKWENDESEH